MDYSSLTTKEREAALTSLEPQPQKVSVVTSAFSLDFSNGPINVTFTEVSVEEASHLAEGAPSAVGHADIAAVFGTELGMQMPVNQTNVSLKRGDIALVGQYKGPRLAEGTTNLPEGAMIVWLKVEVY